MDEVPETTVKNEGRDRRTIVKSSFRRSAVFSSPLNYSSTPAEEDEDLEDIDAIVSVPPPEEIVVKSKYNIERITSCRCSVRRLINGFT